MVARTSAFQFKGENKDVRAVGQALGATHLIEGSVRKAGNRVRITAQLIKADDGTHLWTENYDRELTDIFAIQEDIAQAIAASLRVPLGLAQGETLVRNRTKDEASYEDYLRAKALVRARANGAGQPEAAKLLEQVVARDPDFAPAWALLGLDYAMPRFTIRRSSAARSNRHALSSKRLFRRRKRRPSVPSSSIRKIPMGIWRSVPCNSYVGKFLAAGGALFQGTGFGPGQPGCSALL